MKKWLCILLLFSLAGCTQEPQPERTAYELYFQEADLSFSAGDGAFRTEPVYLYNDDIQAPLAMAQTLMEKLLDGPADETLRSPIPSGTSLLSLEITGNQAQVDLSASYGTLSGVALTLADSAIAMTLSQVPEISSVQITVRGRELAYRERQVLNVREVLLSPEEDVIRTVDVLLYFPDAEGIPVPETRTLELYEGDTQVSAVARAMEDGPVNRELLNPLPEGFQVKTVWLEEDVCYVNLSSTMLEGLEETVVEPALRALESSLCSLEGVEEARFLVDGEFRQDSEPLDGDSP